MQLVGPPGSRPTPGTYTLHRGSELELGYSPDGCEATPLETVALTCLQLLTRTPTEHVVDVKGACTAARAFTREHTYAYGRGRSRRRKLCRSLSAHY